MANHIIWAFNPYQINRKITRQSVAFLESVARTGNAKVEPVFVVSPAEAKVVLEFNVPARVRFQTVAKRASLRVLNKIRFKGLLPPTILVENHLMISYSAKTLAAYAAKVKARKIVVGTQAKEGLQRFLLGSFAETLLSYAMTPMVFVNPEVRDAGKLKKLVFASDFSPTSFSGFKQFADFAKRHNCEIELFHSLPKPFLWAKQAAEFLFGRGMMSVGDYLKVEAANREKAARPFVSWAEAKKIPVRVTVEQGGEESSEAILAFAKKRHADLIGMVAMTGKTRSALLGSTTRGVLRDAQVPLWVLPANRSRK